MSVLINLGPESYFGAGYAGRRWRRAVPSIRTRDGLAVPDNSRPHPRRTWSQMCPSDSGVLARRAKRSALSLVVLTATARRLVAARAASSPVQQASIGRIVTYRSKVNPYDMPAIVTATLDSLWPPGVENGDVPGLWSENHVHLHVFTPGIAQEYQEHNIPMAPVGSWDNPPPGTWRWPLRT